MLARLRRRPKDTPPIPDAFPVEAPGTLLAPHAALLRAIRQLAGVPDTHWLALYATAFESFARLVQRLPASEAHHHAGPGGLLAHGLEVVHHALELRRGQMLPPGASVEVIAAAQDAWTYAVATAALLHDIGKPFTDQTVTLHDRAGRQLGDWVPWLGPIDGNAAWYRVTFPRERRYRLHQRLPPLLARLVVPDAGIRWLATSPDLLEAWIAAIGGDASCAGPIGVIVEEADRRSVAEDLAGPAQRLPTARARPLHERLLTGLRYLLDQGDLPLNRRGAAGWRVGGDLWLVSKRALDAVRDHLEREGQGGVPSRNERLMDELQQHGVLVANGERAIWTVDVAVDDWRQRLTVLRFPVERVWPAADARPGAFAGTVVPVHDDVGDWAAGSGRQGESVSSATDTAPAGSSGPPAAGNGIATSAEPVVLTDTPITDDRARPPSATSVPSASPLSSRPAPSSATTAAPATSDTADDPGRRFVAWLRDGLASGRLAVNQVNARVHTAPEGLLLVSPGIFKDFDPTGWAEVQKRFQRLKLHRKTPQGTNIFTYRVRGGRRQARIRMYLVPEPGRVLPGVNLPPPNPLLVAPEADEV